MILLTLLTGTGGSTYFAIDARRQAAIARQNEEQATISVRKAVESANRHLSEKERADRARETAEKQSALAREQADLARRGLYNVQLARVRDVLWRDAGQALDLLNDPERCPPHLPDFTWGFYLNQAKRDRLTLQRHKGPVIAAAFPPDTQTILSVGLDPTIRLWDAVTMQERGTLEGHDKGVICAAFSPDGKTLASGSADHTIKLWRTQRTAHERH